jgi:hypothetical protein
MPDIVWPPGLPQLQNNGTQYWTDTGGAVRTGVEYGPDKARPRGTKQREYFSTPMELTGAQMADFKAFLRVVSGTCLPFVWEHPVEDTDVWCRLTKEPRWTLKVSAAKDLRRWTGDVEVEILGAYST